MHLLGDLYRVLLTDSSPPHRVVTTLTAYTLHPGHRLVAPTILYRPHPDFRNQIAALSFRMYHTLSL